MRRSYRSLSLAVVVTALTPLTALAATHYASNYTQLKNKLNIANSGDEIVLDAGATFNFTNTSKYTGTTTLDGNTIVGTGVLIKDKSDITIRGASSTNRPHIKGYSMAGDYVLYLQNAPGTIIKDVRFSNAEKGLVIDRSNGVRIENVEVFNLGKEAIHLRDGTSNSVVIGNQVHDVGLGTNNRGEAIYVGSDQAKWFKYPNNEDYPVRYEEQCDNNLFEDNDLGPNIGAEAIDEKEGASFNTYRNNTIDLRWTTNISDGTGNKPEWGIMLKGHASVTVDNTFIVNMSDQNNALRGAINVFRRVEDANYVYESTTYGYDHFVTNNSMTGDNSTLPTLKATSDGGATHGCNTNSAGVPHSVPANNTAFSKLREYTLISGSACNNYPSHTGGGSSPPPSGGGSSSGGSSSGGYGGTFNLPTKIEAEKYTAAPVESTSGNSGGSPSDCTYHGLNVDVQNSSDDTTCNVGWTTSGEKLEYKVGSAGGTYDINLRAATNSGSKQLKVRVNGSLVGTKTITNQGWTGWNNHDITGVSIPSNATIQVEFVQGSVNLNYLNVTSAGGSTSSSSGGGAPSAGTNNVQIRNFGSNRCLQAGGMDNGNPVISAGCDSGNDQSIDVQAHTQSPYLKLKFDNNSLNMDGGTVAEDQVAHMWSQSNHDNRRLDLIGTGTNKFMIKNVTGNKCLRGDWSSAKWKTCNSGDNNQHWYLN